MSDLQKFATRRGAALDQVQRWVIEAMVLGAVADGEFTPRESDRIIRVIADNAEFTGMSADTLREPIESLLGDTHP